MVMPDIKKITLNRRRAELINSTSLEILKQKKISDAVRVSGRFFSKQFESLLVNEVLRDKHSFVVALKSIDLGGVSSLISVELAERGLQVSSILSIANIRTLYATLSDEFRPTWLFPYLMSNSTYLLVMPTFDEYLGVVRHCVGAEMKPGANFFEILFLKESKHFINFSLTSNKHEAVALRKLYVERNFHNILFELSSCISNVSVTFTGIFSISLLNSSAAIYPGRT